MSEATAVSLVTVLVGAICAGTDGRASAVAHPSVVHRGQAATLAVSRVAAVTLQVRLRGATNSGGKPLGWQTLQGGSCSWRGGLPRPFLRGVYPIDLRRGPGTPVMHSRSWLLQVLAPGTLSRPAFATPEAVAHWWVGSMAGARVVALRRWRPPAFDHRDRRLHQLLVVAYVPPGRTRVRDRLGVFITAYRDNPRGRWRLLEATVAP